MSMKKGKSKRKVFHRRAKPINKEEFTQAVLGVLQGSYKGDEGFARQFVIDMVKIFPKAFEHKELLLNAIRSLSRRDSLTVDNVWEHIRHLKDPKLDRIITTIPMGGKN